MKESIRHKLESTRDRFEEIAGLLAEPEVIGDQNRFRDLSREYARLERIVGLFRAYEKLDAETASAGEMARDSDAGIRQLGEEELATLTTRRQELELDLQTALIPPDPHDDR
ncbi:MAG: PCRF domain-containing protein, partial [Woeseiaceae bacterium]